jgi:hypothetical protein
MDFNYTYMPFKLGQTKSGSSSDPILSAIKNVAQVSSRLRTTNKLEDVNALIGDLQKARNVLNNLAMKNKKKN